MTNSLVPKYWTNIVCLNEEKNVHLILDIVAGHTGPLRVAKQMSDFASLIAQNCWFGKVQACFSAPSGVIRDL